MLRDPSLQGSPGRDRVRILLAATTDLAAMTGRRGTTGGGPWR